ncbi:uncharacterized protein TRIADDRAFT_19621 [Trichoplax adhaerens]|uniref:ornithine decarboxylase n=1 Tax=Trichoplax adhaerens TaxID=10228 RepID=B3RKL2_TRIAD|nr:hypothetical protein TRIADDRAFT_19621 [Trichoplax adhaerens]EDV29183.1 hypothetical protein TRIADDRAFT_19621 [Trichoplax adhaerens]|eukprot:XP_002108385.1 hypothetical protein TRIADDRAFT_19621 [Trichoplax adhaerens]
MQWFSLLPRVHPYFALKCNVDRGFLATLLAFGFGFEGVSKAEIDTVLKMGASPEKIIFANPYKPISHIKYAAHQNVNLMTFDNVTELYKIKEFYPKARLLLRLKFDDPRSKYELGKKYGVEIDEVTHILQIARELQLNVVGISYHVGGGYTDACNFLKAIELAKTAFNYAKSIGINFNVLDIGGGFPGQANSLFKKICSNISSALDKHFPVEDNISIIAEPGRYFAETAFTLVLCVAGKREIYEIDQKIPKKFEYYVNDGRYGSFSEFLMSYGCQYPQVIGKKSETLYSTRLWGPTVSGSDCIFEECYLPELEVGDLIYFEEMGAYTTVLGTNFNGLTRPVSYYVIDQGMW